jgi:TonB family protein
MRHWTILTVLALCWAGFLGPYRSFAQDDAGDASEASRKVVNRVVPLYPPMARSIGIKGNVRVEVVVAANGTVKSLEVKGGHPMLAQAAADAVRRWKWVPATRETKEPVIVKFDP